MDVSTSYVLTSFDIKFLIENMQQLHESAEVTRSFVLLNNANSVFRIYKQSQPECKNCETIFDLFSFSYLWEKDIFVTEYPQTEIMECLTFLKQVLNKCSAFFSQAQPLLINTIRVLSFSLLLLNSFVDLFFHSIYSMISLAIFLW